MSQTRTSLARPGAGRGGGRAPTLRRVATVASVLAVGAFGIGGCATEHYPISTSPVYMSGQDRIVVRGGTLNRQRELQRYMCAGDMVLMCDIRGGVAECACGATNLSRTNVFF